MAKGKTHTLSQIPQDMRDEHDPGDGADAIDRSWLNAGRFAACGVVLWAIFATSGFLSAISVALGWSLLALCLIDLKTFRLPDPGTLGLVLVGLGLSVVGLTGPVWHHALGALSGYGAFAVLGWAWHRFRGVEALGLGDAKLLAASGAWVGIFALPSVVLVACCAGLLHVAVLAHRGQRLSHDLAIPFGPALALGFWITWLHGPIGG